MDKTRLLGLILGILSFAIGGWLTMQFMGTPFSRLHDRPLLDSVKVSEMSTNLPPADRSHPKLADWPSFRGPGSTGNADAANPPVTWSDKEGVKWKTALPGPGSSSPIVAGERVYVTCYTGYGESDINPGSPDKLKRHLL